MNKPNQHIAMICAFVFFFYASLNVITAQQKSFDDNDLYDLKNNARKMMEGRNFRQTNIREKFEGGSNVPVEYEKSINEVLQPDRSHFIFEKKTAGGVLYKEYIDVGRDRYIRENGGEWKIFEGLSGGIGSGSGGGVAKIEHTEEYNFTAGEMIDAQKTDHYEKIARYTYTYPKRVEKKTITEGIWLNDEGLFVKTFDETRNETDKIIERETGFYEYDVKLKIERPILPNEKTLDKKTFDAITDSAYKKTNEQSYRIRYDTANTRPTADNKRLLVYESSPLDRRRYIFDFYESDRRRGYELIEIGDLEYEKYDSEAWRVKTERDVGTSSNPNNYEKTTYKYYGKQTINDQTTDLYKKFSAANQSSKDDKSTYKTTSYWINEKGVIIRVRFTTDRDIDVSSNRELNYEYDAKIKIEAPIK